MVVDVWSAYTLARDKAISESPYRPSGDGFLEDTGGTYWFDVKGGFFSTTYTKTYFGGKLEGVTEYLDAETGEAEWDRFQAKYGHYDALGGYVQGTEPIRMGYMDPHDQT